MGGVMQKNRGFTLIELMVTIAVLAIVASIAAPSFSENITRQNLDNSAREILFALNEGEVGLLRCVQLLWSAQIKTMRVRKLRQNNV